jgi:S1-C subfamily serine protease
VVLKAAGEDLSSTADLVEIIQRQAPGTWLPLEIERDGKIQTLVAKFPSLSDTN